jgi:hypothetical protein
MLMLHNVQPLTEARRLMFTASRPSALDRLDVFIGRWLTEGETVATAEAPSVRILASDVYE